MPQDKHNTLIQLDVELHDQVKQYVKEKDFSLSRLINELLLGFLSRESQVVEEMRESIEKRLESAVRGRPATSIEDRVKILEAQERLKAVREKEKEERAEKRRIAAEERAHVRRLEIEEMRAQSRKEIERVKILARTNGGAPSADVAPPKESECIRCGEAECVCPE